MKLLFISTASPEKTLDYYGKKFKDENTKNVQQRWDLTLAKELNKLCPDKLFCISYPPVATFPSSKCLWFSKNEGDTVEELHIDYTQCCNLPILKQAMEIFSIKKLIHKNCSDKTENIIILTACINYQSFKAYTSLKRKYKNIKIVSIVPDLPDHMVSATFNRHQVLKRLLNVYKNKTISVEKKYNGYICFTEQQINFLNDKVPHMIMEGFIDSKLVDSINPVKFDKKVITYAGGINKRYGILELVNGFIKAALSDVELHLYGTGDCVEEISKLQHKRVFYKGLLSREETIAVEKGSYLLVNPRPTNDEFSWCSFPSKIMEYLSAGTPVISSKLLCFSEEWYPMMTFFDEINSDSIANTLISCVDSYKELKSKSIIAREFVNKKKNSYSQAKRIMLFLEENFNAEF